jgi:hypothetical protein
LTGENWDKTLAGSKKTPLQWRRYTLSWKEGILNTPQSKREFVPPESFENVDECPMNSFYSLRHWSFEISAGKAGDAVFCGVPFLLKDLLVECQGAPFVEGSRAVKGYVSQLDSELVRRQKASGLVVQGPFGFQPLVVESLV